MEVQKGYHCVRCLKGRMRHISESFPARRALIQRTLIKRESVFLGETSRTSPILQETSTMISNKTIDGPQSVKPSNVRKYLFHKKLFNIKDNPDLTLFESLMSVSRDFTVICSCNLMGDHIDPCRYYLSCLHHIPGNLKMIFHYLKEVSQMNGKKLSYGHLKELFDEKLDVAMLEFVVLGIDCRDDPRNSRLKIYFGIKNRNPRIEQFLSKVCYGKIQEIMGSPAFMLCIDMYFDGRNERKVYHTFSGSDLKSDVVRQRLRRNFSDKVMKLVDRSCGLTVSYQENFRAAALNFQMDDFNGLFKEIGHDGARKWHDAILQKSAGVFFVKDITLLEDEIDNNDINDINLYYY